MPLPIPNLDDRTFADLVAEGRAMIPRLAPEWTNHNPSDPGITLLELLSWLTESVIYDLNQVRDDSYRAFLKLVDSDHPLAPGESLDAAIVRTAQALRKRTRAASREDFEVLAVELSAGRAARARMIPDSDMEGTSASGEAHVSLVVLPAAGLVGLAAPLNRTLTNLVGAMIGPTTTALSADLRAALAPRLLVTTVLHVVPAAFQPVSVRVRLAGRPDASPTRLAADATAVLRRFLDPYDGGDQGGGWPFGRPVYKSELMQQLERVAGVDHVDELVVNDDPTDSPVLLAPHHLVGVDTVSIDVQLGSPT